MEYIESIADAFQFVFACRRDRPCDHGDFTHWNARSVRSPARGSDINSCVRGKCQTRVVTIGDIESLVRFQTQYQWGNVVLVVVGGFEESVRCAPKY
jgi:hypothetical protein